MRYRQSPDVGVTVVEGDTFLVPPGEDDVFYLDAVSSGLWRALREPGTLEELQATYRTAFPERDGAEVDRDVATAFEALRARGLVVSVP